MIVKTPHWYPLSSWCPIYKTLHPMKTRSKLSEPTVTNECLFPITPIRGFPWKAIPNRLKDDMHWLLLDLLCPFTRFETRWLVNIYAKRSAPRPRLVSKKVPVDRHIRKRERDTSSLKEFSLLSSITKPFILYMLIKIHYIINSQHFGSYHCTLMS